MKMLSSTSVVCFFSLLLSLHCSLASPGVKDLQIPLLAPPVDTPSQSYFDLRHIYVHGTYEYPDVHRKLDVFRSASFLSAQPFSQPQSLPIRSKPVQMQRRRDNTSAWAVEEVQGPNITDKATIMSLGIIAEDTYYLNHSDPNWEDIGIGFNDTADFGWKKDGLRGHIFADELNKTVVIGIKGTSLGYWLGGSESAARDKANDNVLFGCCCGSSSYCNCQSASNTCNNTCVGQALQKRSYYYAAANEIFTNISKIYPKSEIWMVGHSLGGSVASLVGLTHGLPSVTFEAPGQAMAASRLGLPTPPKYHLGTHADVSPGIWNFGHNADALFLGLNTCFGFSCSSFGYAMQSKCHVGMTCVYNTTRDFGWSPGISTHGIFRVIHEVIEYYNETAECKPVGKCRDCSGWLFT